MSYLHASKDGPVAIAQVSREIAHTINDTPSNLIDGYGLLTIIGGETAKNLKVTLQSGDELELTGVDAALVNNRNLLVRKVWATGTTFTSSNIIILG